MKSKKLLTLSAALLMTLAVTACGGNNTPTEAPTEAPTTEVATTEAPTTQAPTETPTEDPAIAINQTLQDAADYLWQLVKSINGATKTASFDLVKICVIGGAKVTVNWTLTVDSGTASAITMADSATDPTKKVTVSVPYYDGLVTEETKYTLTATLSYEGVTKGLDTLLKDGQGKLSVTTPKLVLSNHEGWVALAKDKTTQITLKGTVIDIINPKGGSSSKGSIYFQDAEGYGYYAYCAVPADGKTYAKAGQTIIVSGTRSDYSGQEEFAKNCSYQVVDTTVKAVTYKDGTEDFSKAKAITTSDSNLGSKYQNIPVELKGCIPTKVDADQGYYYFKVGTGTAEYYVRKADYFLSDAQNAAWVAKYMDALDNGKSFDLKGVCSYYNGYMFYGISTSADEIIVPGAALSDEDKLANTETAIKAAVKAVYDADATVTFDIPKYVTKVEYAISADGENDPTVAQVTDKNELTVTLVDKQVVNTVKVTFYIADDKSKEVTLTMTTEDKSLLRYVANLSYDKFVVGSTSTTAEATFNGEKVEFTINHSAIIDAASYKEFKIQKKDGYMSISAPEGYKIGKVELDCYKALNFTTYAGTDATGTQLTAIKTGEGSGVIYTAYVNGDNFYAVNTSTYDQALFSVKVTLTTPATVPVIIKGTEEHPFTVDQACEYMEASVTKGANDATNNTPIYVTGVVANINEMSGDANKGKYYIYLTNEAADTNNAMSCGGYTLAEGVELPKIGDTVTLKGYAYWYENNGKVFQVKAAASSVTDAVAPTVVAVTKGTAEYAITSKVVDGKGAASDKATITELVEKAAGGTNVTFKVTPADGYKMTVKFNGTKVTPVDGIYSVTSTIVNEVTVTVQEDIYDTVVAKCPTVTAGTAISNDTVTTQLGLDGKGVTVAFDKGAAGVAKYWTDGTVRMYGAKGEANCNPFTFTAEKEIKTIEIAYNEKNCSTAKIYVGDTLVEGTTVDDVTTYVINSTSFKLVNDNTGKTANTAVWWYSININFLKAAA